MRIDILTLFPDMCEAVLGDSIIGRARVAGAVEIHCHNIRDYTTDKHGRVDDAPYGGGMGMIMGVQPIYDCYKTLFSEQGKKPHVIYMSPKGKTFNQKKAIELSNREHIVLLCGHYEGIDQRVLDEIVDEEISIGDYVLTGGEMAAVVVTDAVCRMLPGVLSDEVCFTEESHFSGLLEYPQYTRPAEWMGKKVPDVLLSGHHKNIEKWRREQALLTTLEKRPEMLDSASLSAADKKFLESIEYSE
ncbi:MAG: tRNA (guanosine(37)-N1)-methyltransferase TrmD [Ruminococcaceae bacterium]|nr:tRNA (guanosine(37)-N1)-methyltransferase TrmD [Oscillospiraceae bacterium]